MPWWLNIILLLVPMLMLFATGLPVAFSFIMVNIVWAFLLWGGFTGIEQLIFSMFDSVSSFALLPVPLFIMMGEILLHSGVGFNLLDALDKWIGRLPGRLSLVSVTGGTIMSALSGSSIATTAILGTLLLPDMEKRGYKKPMTIGPIIGSGGLAMIIPPSAMAVFLGSIAEISIGQLLIAGIVPGVIIAFCYFAYIVLRCLFNPSLAPTYDMEKIPWSTRIYVALLYIFPMGFIIFLVIGLILLGVTTPTEAAAIGCLGSFILAACYRRLTWEICKKSFFGTLAVTVLMLMIFTGSTAFSQMLAFSGATKGLVQFTMGLDLPPLALVAAGQIIMMVLGCFMDPNSVVMITIPIYMPIMRALHIDTLWVGLMMLINLEMATETPPFGMLLFVMKGIAGKTATMAEIYLSVYPFVAIQLGVIALILFVPKVATWLPSMMF